MHRRVARARMVVTTGAILAVLVGTVSCGTVQRFACSGGQDVRGDEGVRERAAEVVKAFAAKDGNALGSSAHPTKGVRFSPQAYVDVQNDVRLSTAQIKRMWEDTTTYTWGYEDGTGDPIEMTPSQYCSRYVHDRDYSGSSSISVNQDRASGNTSNNAASAYPGAVRVEYFIEPSTVDGQPGNDWAALRLVFERVGDSWYLVGVIHDEWTI